MLRRVRILAFHYGLELLQTRLVLLLLVCWALLLLAGLGLNRAAEHYEHARAEQEARHANAYYSILTNYWNFFQDFYTKRRPKAPLSSIVAGTNYMAPSHVDYRPRYSPTLYHGDDIDPLMRLFRPLDLALAIGLIGLIVAVLLCYNAVNGEIERKNAHILAMYQVRLSEILGAKIIVYTVLLAGSFVLVFGAAAVVFVLFSGPAIAASAGKLALMGLVSTVYIFFTVVCVCTFSAIMRRSGASFLFAMGFVILSVFIIPFLVEHAYSSVRPMGYTEGDLTEDKIRYSRLIHLPIDDVFEWAIHWPPEHPYWRRRQVVRKALTKRWHDHWPSTEEQLRAFHDINTLPGYWFVVRNSEGTLYRDQQYYRELRRHNLAVLRLASLSSPHIALSHALAQLADTSIQSELRLRKEMGIDYFRRYRAWWTHGAMYARHFSEYPLSMWIFARARKPVDLSEVGPIRFPPTPTAETSEEVSLSLAIILLYTLGFGVVGFGAVRRLSWV